MKKYFLTPFIIIFVLVAFSFFVNNEAEASVTCGQAVSYDGQDYNTVQIGDQCWFKENLNVGSKINTAVKHADNSIVEKYCYEDNDVNCDVYGGLYNWDEAMDYSLLNGALGICPSGWHIPTDSEWTTLSSYAGANAAEKLKIGVPLWNGSDVYGFSALPGGDSINGVSQAQGEAAYFWSSTSVTPTAAYDRIIGGGMLIPDKRPDSKDLSFSVRCIAGSPTCTSWAYSDWSTCSSSGQQTRTTISSSPSGCSGGTSTLSQSCNYIPSCTEDTWECGNWSSCSINGTKSRICNKTNDCSLTETSSPDTIQSCNYTPTCTEDTWECGNWSSCSPLGIKTRDCAKTYDCSAVETVPKNYEQCVPDSTDDLILDHKSIIDATVQLLCYTNSRGIIGAGSGTIIDSRGIILTNKHVIKDLNNKDVDGCLVGFTDTIDSYPEFIKTSIIIKQSSNEDIALLKIVDGASNYPYIDLSTGNNNQSFNSKILAYGYPIYNPKPKVVQDLIQKITFSSGDYSGDFGGGYFKTTALLEHGISGGGAYSQDGLFVGITSGGLVGETNTLGVVLGVGNVISWINSSAASQSYNQSLNNTSLSVVLEQMSVNYFNILDTETGEGDTPEYILDSSQYTGTRSNLLNFRTNWLVKNKEFVEVFWVDTDLCLHWIINEEIAERNFGHTWNYEGNIQEFDTMSEYGYEFCEHVY